MRSRSRGRAPSSQTPLIQPGESAALTLRLDAGTYEIYCPVGQDSHRKLGMETRLKVVAGGNPASAAPAPRGPAAATAAVAAASVQPIRVTGGGPVIQILPGAFPFPDSAGPILRSFGMEHEALESQMQNGPYSNNVAPIAGPLPFTAWDKGPVRDSVAGVAEFTTKDGARWKLVLDRVQTNDVPHHPQFGGVILGLYYHGNYRSAHATRADDQQRGRALVHRPSLPQRRPRHRQRDVHVMLLSRTRRTGDFALECWDCSKNAVDELQLQVPPAPASRSSMRRAGSCSSTGSARPRGDEPFTIPRIQGARIAGAG